MSQPNERFNPEFREAQTFPPELITPEDQQRWLDLSGRYEPFGVNLANINTALKNPHLAMGVAEYHLLAAAKATDAYFSQPSEDRPIPTSEAEAKGIVTSLLTMQMQDPDLLQVKTVINEVVNQRTLDSRRQAVYTRRIAELNTLVTGRIVRTLGDTMMNIDHAYATANVIPTSQQQAQQHRDILTRSLQIDPVRVPDVPQYIGLRPGNVVPLARRKGFELTLPNISVDPRKAVAGGIAAVTMVGLGVSPAAASEVSDTHKSERGTTVSASAFAPIPKVPTPHTSTEQIAPTQTETLVLVEATPVEGEVTSTVDQTTLSPAEIINTEAAALVDEAPAEIPVPSPDMPETADSTPVPTQAEQAVPSQENVDVVPSQTPSAEQTATPSTTQGNNNGKGNDKDVHGADSQGASEAIDTAGTIAAPDTVNEQQATTPAEAEPNVTDLTQRVPEESAAEPAGQEATVPVGAITVDPIRGKNGKGNTDIHTAGPKLDSQIIEERTKAGKVDSDVVGLLGNIDSALSTGDLRKFVVNTPEGTPEIPLDATTRSTLELARKAIGAIEAESIIVPGGMSKRDAYGKVLLKVLDIVQPYVDQAAPDQINIQPIDNPAPGEATPPAEPAPTAPAEPIAPEAPGTQRETAEGYERLTLDDFRINSQLPYLNIDSALKSKHLDALYAQPIFGRKAPVHEATEEQLEKLEQYKELFEAIVGGDAEILDKYKELFADATDEELEKARESIGELLKDGITIGSKQEVAYQKWLIGSRKYIDSINPDPSKNEIQPPAEDDGGSNEVITDANVVDALVASGVPREYAKLFAEHSSMDDPDGITPFLLGSIGFQESSFKESVINGEEDSSAGAEGMMQMMPGTWKERVEVDNDLPDGAKPTNPKWAVIGARNYMKDLIKIVKERGPKGGVEGTTLELALAGYNMGVYGITGDGSLSQERIEAYEYAKKHYSEAVIDRAKEWEKNYKNSNHDNDDSSRSNPDRQGEYKGNETNSGVPIPERLKSNGYDVRYFSQWDKRWADKPYTSSGNESQTMAASACGPTSMAMVVSSLSGKDILPTEVADYNLDKGYRTANDGTSWDAFPAFAEKYDIEAVGVSKSTEAIKAFFEKHNKEGKQGYIILSGRDGDVSTPATSAGHFYVIYGITKSGRLLVSDSNSVEKSTESGDNGWDADTILGSTGNFMQGYYKS